MYEVLDDTTAQIVLAIESGDSIRRVAQHLHTPYETVRQAVNRLEDAGYVHYDDGLTVVESASATQPTTSSLPAPASVHPPSRRPTSSHSSVTGHMRSRGSTPSTCGHKAATRSVASPTTIRCSSLFVSRTSTPGRRSSSRSTSQPNSSAGPERSWMDRYRSSSSHARHSTSNTLKATR